jgi:diguanylate cyclase (GGDEF)-like protein/PAS domain S-box-containing protein
MSERRQKDWGLRLVLGAVLLLLTLVSTRQGWFSGLDSTIYDNLVRQLDTPVAENILVVAIDAKSLSSLGRWPFPRNLHAELLNRISQGQPLVVAVDINFAEPDQLHPQNDAMLVEATRENGRVVFPVVLEQYSKGAELRESLPFPDLRQAAAALGHVHVELEADGIARSAFLMAGLDRPVWPALSLAMARVAGDWPRSRGFPDSARTAVYRDLSPYAWRNHRQVLVPFPTGGQGIDTVSYVDVLNGTVSSERFWNRYVLVGATAPGLGDNIPTPVSAYGRPVSGVEFNAWVLNGLLQNRLIVPVSRNWQYIFNALLVVLMLLLYRPRGWGWVYGIILLLIVVLTADYLLLAALRYWYPPAVMLVSIVLFFLVANGHLLRKLLRVLFEERRLSQTALTAIGEAVVHLDGRGHIVKFNPMAEKFSGMDAGDAGGKPVDDVFHFRSSSGQPFLLHDRLQGQLQDFNQILLLGGADGTEYRVNMVLNKVSREGRNNQTTVMVLTDVSKEHALASEVSHRETHSILTDLPNQTLMAKRLAGAMQRAGRNQGKVAVVYLDIDHFSKINEVRGIDIGNRLLQAIAGKLKGFLGGQVVVGHVGGDEFLLVLEQQRLDRSMDDMVGLIFALFARPLVVDDRGGMRVSVTLGVSIYPEHGDVPELLIGRASAAMHYGKGEGGGQIVYYEPGMQDRATRVLELESYLHQALNSGQFEVFYQPLIEAPSLKVVGVEALARLRDAGGHYIPPEEFIEVAERIGLITEMGYQQLSRACGQLQEWRTRGFPLRLSYNFSPRQMSSFGLVKKIENIIRLTGFAPEFLDFEITENVLLSSDPMVEQVLDQIHAMGIGITIDDFGTGYSAMSYLTRFHFDRLKIDRSFVNELNRQEGSSAITSAIITMAHDLGMAVVAEGVETHEQYELLLAQGCDEMQGYYLGKPMPAKEFQEYLLSSQGHIRLPGG